MRITRQYALRLIKAKKAKEVGIIKLSDNVLDAYVIVARFDRDDVKYVTYRIDPVYGTIEKEIPDLTNVFMENDKIYGTQINNDKVEEYIARSF